MMGEVSEPVNLESPQILATSPFYTATAISYPSSSYSPSMGSMSVGGSMGYSQVVHSSNVHRVSNYADPFLVGGHSFNNPCDVVGTVMPQHSNQSASLCTVCNMFFPPSYSMHQVQEHYSKCQEREILYQEWYIEGQLQKSNRIYMNAEMSKKRRRSKDDIYEDYHTAKQSHPNNNGDMDILLGAALGFEKENHSDSLTANEDGINQAGEDMAADNSNFENIIDSFRYCNYCGERTFAHKAVCHCCQNRKRMTSTYRGVCANRGKWQVQINAGGKRHYLGYFPSEVAAAKAYDAAAIYFHGNKAKLNFDANTCRDTDVPQLLKQIILNESNHSANNNSDKHVDHLRNEDKFEMHLSPRVRNDDNLAMHVSPRITLSPRRQTISTGVAMASTFTVGKGTFSVGKGSPCSGDEEVGLVPSVIIKQTDILESGDII